MNVFTYQKKKHMHYINGATEGNARETQRASFKKEELTMIATKTQRKREKFSDFIQVITTGA